MSFLYVSIFDSILIYMVATLIIYVSIELYNFYIKKFLVENCVRTERPLWCASKNVLLRHFNLFKEMLNTNACSRSLQKFDY
jgi:hypothetical protein